MSGFECEFKNENDCGYGWLLHGLYRPTPEPTDTLPPSPILLLFITIIFGIVFAYVFEYKLCENVIFGELNVEFNCEYQNRNVN